MFNDVDLKVQVYEMIIENIYFPSTDKNLFVPYDCINKLINKEKDYKVIDKQLIPFEEDFNTQDTSTWKQLMGVCQDENKTYDGWSKMCFFLPEGKIYEDLFCNWSKISWKKYNETECRNKFQNSKHIASIGALINMAKSYDCAITNDIVDDIKIDGKRQYALGTGNVRVAKMFYSLCKDKYVYTDGSWYKLTEIGRWIKLEKENNGLINAFFESVNPVVVKLSMDIRKGIDETKKLSKEDSKTIKSLSKLLVDMNEVGFQVKCVKFASTYFSKDVNFDDDPYLVGFNNGVWDFNKDVVAFRKYKPQDYMTMSVGYDWDETIALNEEKNKELNTLIKEILGDDDIVNYYIDSMARTLIGISSQIFNILNGNGGNGKSVLCDGLSAETFGGYGYLMPVHCITDGKKTGANTELAQCHNKRFIHCKEPSGKKCIDNASIKDLTGGGSTNAREIFSKRTKTNLCGTLNMEINPKLNWAENPSDAEIRRVVLLPFKSKYTDDVDEINPKKRIYQKNPIYTTPKWKSENVLIFFNILKDRLIKNKMCLDVNVPTSLVKATKTYLSRGIMILEFINEHFDDLTQEECKNQKKTGDSVISLLKFMNMYECSTYYNLLSRDEKIKSKKNVEDFFETNAFGKKYFVDRFRIKDKLDIRKAIVNLKSKEIKSDSGIDD
jgi:hypothetical protein